MKLVILDRDGTINYDSDQYIKSPAEWKPIPGSLEAIARLTQGGWRVVVATNQSGIARGLFDMATLNAIHAEMHRAVSQAGGRIDAIFFCPHAADSRLRVPQAQARHAARDRAALQRRRSSDVPMVGDALRDLQAAAAAGAQPGPGAHRQGQEDARRRRPAAAAPRSSPTSPRSPRVRCRSMIVPALGPVLRSRCCSSPRPTRSLALASAPAAAHAALPRHLRLVAADALAACDDLLRHPTGGSRDASTCPRRPSVILSKHQSAWETLAFQQIFPPQVHVLKRELLWIPFFGWGLALMSPIAIDRGAAWRRCGRWRAAASERLEQGFWVVVFPEGTRVAPGETRASTSRAAPGSPAHAGAPVVPVAHNAGRCWPRNSFLKYPGEVTVRIGPPIESAGRDPETINAHGRRMDRERSRRALDS